MKRGSVALALSAALLAGWTRAGTGWPSADDVSATAEGVACRVLATGAETNGDLWLEAVPTAVEVAVVKADGMLFAASSTSARRLWRALSAGDHTVEHSVGDVSISATYHVSAPICFGTANPVACRVLADGSEVVGEQSVGAAPTDTARAVVTADGAEVLSATTTARGMWRPRTKGKQTLAHVSGDVSLAAEYEVADVISDASACSAVCRAIASGSEIGGELILGAVPTAMKPARVTVDDVLVTNAVTAARVVWTALACGDHTVSHTVDDVTISSDYAVTNLVVVVMSPQEGGPSFAIPPDWFRRYPKLGGTTVFEWQKIAEGAGVKTDASGATLPVWHDYVAGTDPTDAASRFTAGVAFEDGKPVVSWSPALNGDGVREGARTYRVWGKESLTDAAWREVAPSGEAGYRFFRVTVEMP